MEINNIGYTHGSLTVIRHFKGKRWVCRCKCGQEHIFTINQLKQKVRKSCGNCRWTETRIDIKGEKFGKWTALELAAVGKGTARRYLWKCQCECGKIRNIGKGILLSGTATSCIDCLPITRIKGRGEAAFNKLHAMYEIGAFNRNLEWGLSKEEFKKIVTSNCYYTGLPPSRVIRATGGDLFYNGVDRLDSKIGYRPENCVPCNAVVNKMKMNLGYSEFIEMCAQVTKFMEQKLKNEVSFELKAV